MYSLNSEINRDIQIASLKLKKISTKDIIANEQEIRHNINICPDKFKTNFTINSINEQWLINLSNTEISNKDKILLQLG